MIFVAIPVHNRVAFTLECLASIEAQARADVRVIVADGGSTDGTADAIADKFPETVLLRGGGDWYWTAATNRAVEAALEAAGPQDHVLTLNNDTRLEPGYYAGLRRAPAAGPRAMIGSVMLSDEDGTVADGGVLVSWPTAAFRTLSRGLTLKELGAITPRLQPVDVLSGRGTLIPIDVFKTVGTFDEHALPHYGADYEYSRRAAQRGFELLVCRDACLIGRVHESGLHTARPTDVGDSLRTLWNIRSAKSLKYRWRFALRAVPRYALPTFLMIDTFRVVGGTLRGFVSTSRTKG
jgi:GT2 family glycosyltransferase